MDRRVQFTRGALQDNGLNTELTWTDLETDAIGPKIWAKKTDISDGERWRASEVAASITTRFVLRWSAFTATITPKDRLICDGVTYEISGKKDVGGARDRLEITASVRTDL
jgi:SPP1 family predicted phage head-tail adaptor